MAKSESCVKKCREKESSGKGGVCIDGFGNFKLEKVPVSWNDGRHYQRTKIIFFGF